MRLFSTTLFLLCITLLSGCVKTYSTFHFVCNKDELKQDFILRGEDKTYIYYSLLNTTTLALSMVGDGENVITFGQFKNTGKAICFVKQTGTIKLDLGEW